jgi:hypothetical protein
VKTMAEVLEDHWSASTHSDSEPHVDKCDGCGEVLRAWGDDSAMNAQLAAHQSAMLTAAGFGPVKAATLTEALEKAEVIHVHHHDIEHHARSYNEGYDAAITQGLADYPTLADDWLQGKLRAAAAGALRDAADDFGVNLTSMTGPRIREWLTTRAATIEEEA